jgi:hypothetical protein
MTPVSLFLSMLQMKHTILFLLVVFAICVMTAALTSHCPQPLNCTGKYFCPLIASGPGIRIVSGEEYCTCCPVSITYLGRDKSESAVRLSHSQCTPFPSAPFFQLIFHLLNTCFLKEFSINVLQTMLDFFVTLFWL